MGGIALLVFTDGRKQCLERTLDSVAAFLPDFDHRLIVNDSTDFDYGTWLEQRFGGFKILHSEHKRGFGGAIRYGWKAIQRTSADFVWHQEDDFLFHRYVPLHHFAEVLNRHPEIIQMAVKRQAWNPDEVRAGVYVEQHPDDYVEVRESNRVWLEHRRHFTTNPSLYRSSLCESGWPEGDNSEGVFTHRLLEDPTVKFGLWGSKADRPWVRHIGTERVGCGY